MSVKHLALCALLAGCAGPAAPKPDPYVTIWIRAQLNASSRAGQSNWPIVAIVEGLHPSRNQTVVEPSNSQFVETCSFFAAALGQESIQLFAATDTVALHVSSSQFDSVLAAFLRGITVPHSGFDIRFTRVMKAMEPIASLQYARGHGLRRDDPVKWRWTWNADGTTEFVDDSTSTGCPLFYGG